MSTDCDTLRRPFGALRLWPFSGGLRRRCAPGYRPAPLRGERKNFSEPGRFVFEWTRLFSTKGGIIRRSTHSICFKSSGQSRLIFKRFCRELRELRENSKDQGKQQRNNNRRQD